jgi:uncharacterized protein DUF998
MRTQLATRTPARSAALTCGAVAGPLFVVVGLAQAFTREGFDLRHDTLSLLGNGDLGWIQVTNFILSGILYVVGAVGMRRALPTGRGSTWGPRLIAAFGVGMIGSGVFRPDPAFGFPPGTAPGKPVTTSWHSGVHYTIASLTFVALVAAFLVLARWFTGNEAGWAIATRIVAGMLIVATAAISVAAVKSPVNIFFVTTAVLAFLWASVLPALVATTTTEAYSDTRTVRSAAGA